MTMIDVDRKAEMGAVLEVGAGESPYLHADVTVDIRDDLPGIDFPGVEVGTDALPVDDESFDVVVLFQVLEHVAPDRVGHVFRECDRVLRSGGLLHIELPHAGTLSANTDLTHRGAGGTTPAVRRYFSGESQRYWPELDWEVNAWAELSAPTIVRGSRRLSWRVRNAAVSQAMADLPFVTGKVVIQATKQ